MKTLPIFEIDAVGGVKKGSWAAAGIHDEKVLAAERIGRVAEAPTQRKGG
jgi:hypothetical protein